MRLHRLAAQVIRRLAVAAVLTLLVVTCGAVGHPGGAATVRPPALLVLRAPRAVIDAVPAATIRNAAPTATTP